jgi:hypothetical protein
MGCFRKLSPENLSPGNRNPLWKTLSLRLVSLPSFLFYSKLVLGVFLTADWRDLLRFRSAGRPLTKI